MVLRTGVALSGVLRFLLSVQPSDWRVSVVDDIRYNRKTKRDAVFRKQIVIRDTAS